MLNTSVYAIFIVLSVALYWLAVPARYRPHYLAAVSFAYVFAYFPKETTMILCLAILTYIVGLAAGNKNSLKPMAAAGGIAALLMVLGYFKYASFLSGIINMALQPLLHTNLSVPKLIVPIGISYFTFKMIHYIVDIYKGKIAPHGFGDFLSYIFFFPILVSGPIERFQSFLAQVRSGDKFYAACLYAGLPRIASGLFKKVVLADTLAATAILLQQPDLASWQYWAASFAYSFQLYFDFSGYTDMAIGISRLFGLTIMENFNWPYLASDISAFWKRWHMSLTAWFRDYLFIPLGGSRGTLGLIIRNTLIVMAVTGLWHGAGWHFIFWGLYHAVGLIGLRLYRKFLLPGLALRSPFFSSRLAKAGGVLVTFNFVNIGWIFFACSGSQSIYVLRHMFGF